MPKIISMFNNKGGVGKTTTSWFLADAMGRKGYKVLLIDFDPQCNLSIAVLGEERFEEVLKTDISQPYGLTLRAFLQLFLQGTGGQAIHLHQGKYTSDNVHLIAGDFWLNIFAESLNVGADLLTGTGLAKYVSLVRMVADAEVAAGHEFDYVIVDLPPSFGALVRASIYSSDYVVVPCTSDTYSAYCIGLIGQMLPAFQTHWTAGLDAFKAANPHFTNFDSLGQCKFGGWIFNGYDTRGGGFVQADRAHFERVQKAIDEHLVSNAKISNTPNPAKNSLLGQIEDMNVLIQNSIWLGVPISILDQHRPLAKLRNRGSWAANQLQQIGLLRTSYETLADNVVAHCV